MVIRIYVALVDNVGLMFLSHKNRVREELQADVSGHWELRKALIRSYKLKNPKWDLFRDTGGTYEWATIPVYVKTVQEGDDYRLVIKGRKQKQPNAPGRTKEKESPDALVIFFGRMGFLFDVNVIPSAYETR
jgi:hypothetical protein